MALAGLESATAALRRALLTGDDPTDAGRGLTAAADSVRALLPTTAPRSLATETPIVPGEPSAETDAETTPPAGGSTSPPSVLRAKAVTKRLTKTGTAAPLDPATVRVERNLDPYGQAWRVLAGDLDAPTVLGYVDSARTVHGARRGRAWSAVTAAMLPLSDRARTRAQAVAILVSACRRTGIVG